MKKVCIFDFDGTLVNSITDVAICFNETLVKFGLKPYSIDLYKNFVGGNLDTVVGKLILNQKDINDKNLDIEGMKKYYLDLYLNSKKENTKPYNGIMEMLNKLQNNNIKLAINTNKKQILTEELCNKFFADINFEKIVGFKENYPSKPNPQAVYDILEYFGVQKDEAIYIGDGKSDVLTAENAEIDAIFVEWGQGKEEDKNSHAVKMIANTPEDIYNFVMNSK